MWKELDQNSWFLFHIVHCTALCRRPHPSVTVSPSVKFDFCRILEGMAMMGWAVKDIKLCMQGAEVVVRSLEWPQWGQAQSGHRSCLEWVTPKAATGKSHSKSKNRQEFGPHLSSSRQCRALSGAFSVENSSSARICDVSHLSACSTADLPAEVL